MSRAPTDDDGKFDMSVEPASANAAVAAEADEQEQKKRDAALASTYDPALAHHGKTDEEMLEERQDAARLVMDVAIVAGVVVAVEAAKDDGDGADDAPEVEDAEDGGGK